jgi:diacylglycerol kinase (ATP)
MRVLLVLNRKSGSSDDATADRLVKILSELGAVRSIQPEKKEFDAPVDGAAGHADLVVAAGGDGSVNRTVNAIRDRLSRVELGVIPLGTGNDFARTLGIPLGDPEEAARAIVEGQGREVDVGLARGQGVERLFVNACIGGFPVEVDEAVSGGVKRLLGPLAYIAAGAKAATNLKRFTVTMNGVRIEDCVAAGVGNGRTSGGGIMVWPDAEPDDGMLEGCAMPASNPAKALELAARVKRGTHTELEGVATVSAGTIRIGSDPPMEFNVDGELLGLTAPAEFHVRGRLVVRAPR